MYACIHTATANPALVEVALQFSPAVERTSETTVVFSIAALGKLIGSLHQIISEICRAGYERHLEASLAIATNPDTAILLACHCPGVTLASRGEERLKLAPILLSSLVIHASPANLDLLDTLHRWGLKTCEDLALLPETGVAERLGPNGVYLRNLARGAIDRPLRLHALVTSYEERMELDHPLGLLEPLLLLLGRVLGDLCMRLRSQSRAARLIEARFELEEGKHYRCELEFPVPLDEMHSILKLLQLHLERHPPEAPVLAFTLRMEAAEPRRVQGGLFLPPTPAADKLQITLARIAGMVGKENAGTPVLLNTHRPDTFEMGALVHAPHTVSRYTTSEKLRLAIRLFRPALHAEVNVSGASPRDVRASIVKGSVICAAGPWKTSGEWWDPASSWDREEWDVALNDGALYRIYLESRTHAWYVHGIYD